MKTCNKCSKELPLECFIKNTNGTYRSKCRSCMNEEQRLRNAKPDSARQRYKTTLINRYYNLKSEANRRGKFFTLTFKEYCQLVSNPCFYCNNALGELPKTQGGIDRLDSSLGYTFENSVPCCCTCNRIKGELSPEEAIVMIRALVEYRRMLKVA